MSSSHNVVDIKVGVNFHRDAFSLVILPLDVDDAFYVACARDGIFLEPHAVTMHQLKAVTRALVEADCAAIARQTDIRLLADALDAAYPPPPGGKTIVDIDGGDMILPIMDGPWAGQYLSWNPALGRTKHLLYPEPQGSSFVVGRDNGRECWWTLKQ
jgi:hypothetical protein